MLLKESRVKELFPVLSKYRHLTLETPLSCLNTCIITVSWRFVHLSKYCVNATAMTALKDFMKVKNLISF